MLVVKGFNSRWDGVTYRWVRGHHRIRRFSYRGLDARGRPLVYERDDTHRSVPELAREMRRQVEALHDATGAPVGIVAESEGALITQVFLASTPRAPVDAVVLLSPLVEPGRVFYPPRGDEGWGVATGAMMRGISAVIGALGPVDVSADEALFRSIVDLGPSLGALLACPPPRVRSYAVLPVDAGVSAPSPLDVELDHRVVPAFHGGLLGDATTARTIAAVLDGRPTPEGSPFWAAVGDVVNAARVTVAGAGTRAVARGVVARAARCRRLPRRAARAAPCGRTYASNMKRLIASTTHAGFSAPSISTVLSVMTCTPPGTSSMSRISQPIRMRDADGNGRREPDLVGAVVDAHRGAGHLHELREQVVRDRQRQIAVRDGRAERAVLRARGIDVDPLVVAGGVGEQVHPLLGDLHPLAEPEVRSLRRAQRVRILELRHRRIVRCKCVRRMSAPQVSCGAMSRGPSGPARQRRERE